MKRVLTIHSTERNKELLKHYDRTIKNTSINSINSLDLEPSTEEEIIVPISMLPDISKGVIRFSNNNIHALNEPLQYLTLNTSELERDNYSTAEEFRIKSVRIINSPR